MACEGQNVNVDLKDLSKRLNSPKNVKSPTGKGQAFIKNDILYSN